MSDFDTRRIGEIAELENKILALQTQLNEHKADAEKWKPVASSEVEISTASARVTLQFGGKVAAVTMTADWLDQLDVTSATTLVLEKLSGTLILDRLRPVIQVEVEKIKKNLVAVSGAGKW